MNLTKEVKQAIIKVLLKIIKADGKLKDSEISFIHDMQNHLDLSQDETKEAQSFSFDKSCSILKKIDTEQKKTVVRLMHEAIWADEKIEDKEVIVFEQICKEADLPSLIDKK